MLQNERTNTVKKWRRTIAFLAAWVLCAVALADGDPGPKIESFTVNTSSNLNTVRFPAEAGTIYELQRSSLLSSDATWPMVDIRQADTDGTMELTDGIPDDWARAFYRIAPLSAATEDSRARQNAQTGVAAAILDYQHAVKSLTSQSDTKYDMFLSGDFNGRYRYRYYDLFYGTTNLWSEELGYGPSWNAFLRSGLRYGKTNFWNGEAADWLPASVRQNPSINLDDVSEMEWMWFRERPGTRSRILGRYAYVCFNLSGCVDANLLGRDFGVDLPSNGYGAQTNRNNVRKMLLNGVHDTPSTDTSQQLKLAQYQKMWGSFDTPVALDKLTDGDNGTRINDGANGSDGNHWPSLGVETDESRVGPLSGKEHLSCYSSAATHRGSGSRTKQPCSVDNIVYSEYFSRLIAEMGGNVTDMRDVRMALTDYFDSSSVPQGTDYPSVKAVPMFNEIKAEVQLKQDDGTGSWYLKFILKPEFWCPFPSEDTPQNTYVLQAPTIGGGSEQSGNADIWIRVLASTSAGIFQPTLVQNDTPPSLAVKPTTVPKSPGELVYTLDIEDIPTAEDGTPLPIRALRVAGVFFQKPWKLLLGGSPVDSTPAEPLAMTIAPNVLSHGSGGNMTGIGYLEVDDPRLNHLAGRWCVSTDGSMDEKNSCLDAARNAATAKMGYAPGHYMYCRNGTMHTPAELGYIPVYDGSTPWMTLDIFSEYGIGLMNTLLCDEYVWNAMESYDVFYTNGTINPYTRDPAVLNGAFYGLDIREVPNMAGIPNTSTEVLDAERTKALSEQLVKNEDPDGHTFIKDGPGGWTRVLRSNDFNFNKNERIALAHNTWGLFNESDSLFLVFVVAQSIVEAANSVDPVGNWNNQADMVTGERRAVALCWMDTSAEGAADDLTQKLDILQFKFLDE